MASVENPVNVVISSNFPRVFHPKGPFNRKDMKLPEFSHDDFLHKVIIDALEQERNEIEEWLQRLMKHLGMTQDEFVAMFYLESETKEVDLNSHFLTESNEIRFSSQTTYTLKRRTDVSGTDEGQDR